MKLINKVRGSKEASKELIVDKDVVYVHNNIRKLTIDELKEQNPELSYEELKSIEEYEYEEIQYTKEEYIELMYNQNKKLEGDIINLEVAVTEIYEEMIYNG